MSLSVAIITLNEEANLARTLRSVAWADEIVVVDSGSTDRTRDIAGEMDARVIQQDWLGFGAQKNFALRQCSGDWLLSLDADEEVSPELARETQEVVRGERSGFDAYSMPRRNLFLGRWLRRGGMYPDRKLRLVRKGAAWFAERPVHEDMEYTAPVGELKGDLIHHAYPTVAGYLEHLQRYSDLGAQMVPTHGALWFTAQTLLNPYATFFYNYFVRGGILDGREGLLYHAYHSTYISWKYAKARALQVQHSHPHDH
jgi:glycosyltransferase involved in cell wall biosynthesis